MQRVDAETKFKLCIKCKDRKSVTAFHKDARRGDGLFPYCKECRVKPKKPKVYRPVEEVLSNYLISSAGCWEWQGVINFDGYGMSCYRGKPIRAHRLSLLNSLGMDSSDLLALHHCDNRCCINPAHLYLGTPADNMNDKRVRDRGNHPRGEDSRLSVLSKKDVIKIFKDGRRHKLIAQDYGVSPSSISSIKTGRIWSHTTKNL